MEEDYLKFNELSLVSLGFLGLLHEFNFSFETDNTFKHFNQDKKIKYTEIKDFNKLVSEIQDYFNYIDSLDIEVSDIQLNKLKVNLNSLLNDLKSNKQETVQMIEYFFALKFWTLSNDIFAFIRSSLETHSFKIKNLKKHNELFFKDLRYNSNEISSIIKSIKKYEKRYIPNSFMFFLSSEATLINGLNLYDELIRKTYNQDEMVKYEEIKTLISSILFSFISTYEKFIYSISYQLGINIDFNSINLKVAMDFIKNKNSEYFQIIQNSDRYQTIQSARKLRNAETHRLSTISFSEINGYNLSLIIEIKTLLDLYLKIK